MAVWRDSGWGMSLGFMATFRTREVYCRLCTSSWLLYDFSMREMSEVLSNRAFSASRYNAENKPVGDCILPSYFLLFIPRRLLRSRLFWDRCVCDCLRIMCQRSQGQGAVEGSQSVRFWCVRGGFCWSWGLRGLSDLIGVPELGQPASIHFHYDQIPELCSTASLFLRLLSILYFGYL